MVSPVASRREARGSSQSASRSVTVSPASSASARRTTTAGWRTWVGLKSAARIGPGSTPPGETHAVAASPRRASADPLGMAPGYHRRSLARHLAAVLLGGGRTLRYDGRMKVFVVIALVLLVATPVAAQPVQIEKPAPPAEQRERERAVITPGLSGEGRPLEADNYPR